MWFSCLVSWTSGVGDLDWVRSEVETGALHAGLVIPAELHLTLQGGRQATVTLLAPPDAPRAVELGVLVEAVLNQEGTLIHAARFAAAEGAGDLLSNLERAATIDAPGVRVLSTTTGVAAFPEGLNPFAMMAPSLLLMYIFLTSLTASLGIIEARRRGIITHMYATPTPVGAIVAGEALGRLGIALVQGLIVMVGSALLFRVSWGDPVGALLLTLLFCLVASGAAMLLGSLLRAEGPAMGAAVAVGLGLAAIGGVMVPLEMLGDTAQTVALVTPHAWAYRGFSELVRHGGGVSDIVPQLGVLAGFAVVLFTLGTWYFRRTIVS